MYCIVLYIYTQPLWGRALYLPRSKIHVGLWRFSLTAPGIGGGPCLSQVSKEQHDLSSPPPSTYFKLLPVPFARVGALPLRSFGMGVCWASWAGSCGPHIPPVQGGLCLPSWSYSSTLMWHPCLWRLPSSLPAGLIFALFTAMTLILQFSLLATEGEFN